MPCDISKYIGIQFKEKGRTIEEGVDCWGLFRIFYKNEFGIELPSYDEMYENTEDEKVLGRLIIQGMVEEWAGKWNKIEKGTERFGDGILLRLKGHPMHVGFIVGPKNFIHILDGCNSVRESYESLIWRKRVLGIYRLEGINND